MMPDHTAKAKVGLAAARCVVAVDLLSQNA